jgi:hypothetical protein
MPLTDRPEFQAWLARHNERDVGRPRTKRTSCMACGGELDHEVSVHECVACLAERFGIETAEYWIADVLAGLVRAAANPVVLAQVIAEIVPFARDVIEHRAPLSTSG